MGLVYGAPNQAITHILASLADASESISSELDQETLLANDYKLTYKIKSGSSGVSSSGKVFFYVISDNGAGYPDNDNLKTHQIALPMNMIVNATTYIIGIDLISVFGGFPPGGIKIVVSNQSGAAFDGTEGNHTKIYQTVKSS